MSMTVGGNRGLRAEMNVTPMIDVLLVLLVIFMIVAPLKTVGLPATVPQPAADVKGPERVGDLVLTVKDDGTVLLNQEAVALENLPARLAEIYRFRGDAPVFVRGGRELYFRQVAKVMDIARGAGMMHIALMTTDVR